MASNVNDADADKLVLKVWNFGYPEDEEMRKIHQDIVDQYNKSHSYVKLVFEHYDLQAYYAKIDVALASNEMPDIFVMLDEWFPLSRKMLDANVVGDLTESLNADAAFKSTIIPGALEAFSYNGKPYSIPVFMTWVQELGYNREILDDYGIAPPKTWDELLAAVDKLYATGVKPIEGERDWLSYIALRLGGDERYKKVFAAGDMSDELFQQAADLMYELREKHHAFSKRENNYASTGLFLRGEAAFTMERGVKNDLFNQPGSRIDEVEFIPFPTIEGGAGKRDTSIGAWGTGFAMSSEAAATHRAEAYEAMKYLASWKTQEPITRIRGTIPAFRDFSAPEGEDKHVKMLKNRYAQQVNRLVPNLDDIMRDGDYDRLMSNAAARAKTER